MGGPGHLEKAIESIKAYILGWFLASGLLLIGLWWGISKTLELKPVLELAILIGIWLFISIIVGLFVGKKVSAPLYALSQAILHVSPSPIPVPAPDIERLSLAKELVANLTRQVYEYASGAGVASLATGSQTDLSIQQLPVAVIGLDVEANITFANPKTQEYTGSTEKLDGKNLYGLFDILFQDENTLEDWIEKSREKSITAQNLWHGVRFSSFEGKTQYFDLAASYNKQTGQHKTEVMITLFDQTDIYSEQDDSLSFVAMAVHELRTPLTVLRGYIEVFKDELSKDLDPEMQDFIQKMQASAENLTAFVGNILNVARIEQNQLTLKLHEAVWKETLSSIIETMRLRAKVHGKQIELIIAEGLPTVGIDTVSISEVLINLLDNAIKYSPSSKKIIRVTAGMTKDGLVETIVQDFGVGIPQSIMPNLFEKYSRNHRNRSTISGTGLGLYLSKALVSAHGGNIWVRSKEGEGTMIGFTILPYSQLADASKSGDNGGITRSAHGWIKNHSLSRK